MARGPPAAEGRGRWCAAGMDMGRDNGGVVDEAYVDKAPYAFTGTLRTVVFDLQPMSLEDELALHGSSQHTAIGAGAAG